MIFKKSQNKEIKDSFIAKRNFRKRVLATEVIAKLPANRQNAASDEDIAPRREGGLDESFAISSTARGDSVHETSQEWIDRWLICRCMSAVSGSRLFAMEE